MSCDKSKIENRSLPKIKGDSSFLHLMNFVSPSCSRRMPSDAFSDSFVQLEIVCAYFICSTPDIEQIGLIQLFFWIYWLRKKDSNDTSWPLLLYQLWSIQWAVAEQYYFLPITVQKALINYNNKGFKHYNQYLME